MTQLLPVIPDTELRYPLARNGELVITRHSDRSYSTALTIVGLTDEEIEALSNSLLYGEILDHTSIALSVTNVAGGLAERSQIDLVRQLGSKPISNSPFSSKTGNGSDSGSGSDSNSGNTGKKTRKRITDDELNSAYSLLLAFGNVIDGKSKAEVLSLTCVDPRLWAKVSKRLIDEQVWRAEGEKRNRRYYYNIGAGK